MTAMSAAQYTFITLVGAALALTANSAPAQSPPVFHVRRQRESHVNGSLRLPCFRHRAAALPLRDDCPLGL